MIELPPGGEEEEEEEEEDEQEEGAEKPYEMDNECKDEDKESTAALEVETKPIQADEMEHVEASSAGKCARKTCSQSPKGQCTTKTNTHLINLMLD